MQPDNDPFFTNPARAKMLAARVLEFAPHTDLFLEPAAGDGAFLQYLPTPAIGIDIDPRAEGILKADFFEWRAPSWAKSIAVITNPPFGHAGNRAVEYYNHAATMAETIAMILPASFRKASMLSRLDPRFELVEELDLPDEPFRRDGEIHRVNVVFQIWRRTGIERPAPLKPTTHRDFEFVRSIDEADFAVRRVGARAGAILDIPPTCNGRKGLARSSNYFVRAAGVSADAVRATMAAIDFSDARASNVKVPSIAKTEIVTLYDAMKWLRGQTSVADRSARPSFEHS
ncbi:MAG: hypothetical protein KDK53_19980 [Maritimibacter sp.]|nr:hypothetical protein [Maritimibacter sp.]